VVITGRGRRFHFSLRARITLGFALGALVLSTAIATITYFVARSQIVSQQLSAIVSQAKANATEFEGLVSTSPLIGASTAAPIDSTLSNPVYALSQIYASAEPTNSVVPIFYSIADQSWHGLDPSKEQSLLPEAFRARTISTDMPAYEVFDMNGSPHVAVAIPVDPLTGIYFQVTSLEQTTRTLQIILVALVVAGVIATLAGAVVGRWAAGLALRPLRTVSEAALAIASGHLGTRLETEDAPDLAALASSFNRMVDRLQQRIERDARFASDVSHELRSPLTTLATSLAVIEGRREELPERSRQALDLVAAEVRRFQRMVAELLEISRLDSGSADFQESVVPIREVVRRAAGAANAAVPVVIDAAVTSQHVVVDKRRFERVLANLLENAERYAGGATQIVVSRHHDAVRIAVEDQGPGILPAERERIFERFARGSVAAGSRGGGGGTGLGLALVLEHVKLHGGTVWVEDNEPSGARFVIELPIAPQDLTGDEDEDVAETPQDPPPTPSPPEEITEHAGAPARSDAP
jgi:signal transduction histidine kinase